MLNIPYLLFLYADMSKEGLTTLEVTDDLYVQHYLKQTNR